MKRTLSLLLILTTAAAVAAGPKKENEIRKALIDGNNREFMRAVELIKREKPDDYLPVITEMIIKGKNIQRRDLLLGALKKYNTIKTAEYWLEILEKTGSLEIKLDIIKILKGLDNRRVTASLIRHLTSPFSTIRKEAASVLRKSRDDRIYLTILQLTENSNPLYRLYAVDALMQLYDKRLYPALLELLKDKNKSVRIYTLNCILTNRLTESLPFVRKTASTDNNREVKIEAIRTIKGLNDRNSQFLLNQLITHNDRRIRKEAIIAIRELNLRSSSVHLSIRLRKEDRDENIEEIIKTLIRFRNAGNFTGLKNSALSHKNFRIRAMAVYALGIINNQRGVAVLSEAMKDPDYRVRAEACHSLGMFRSRDALAPLLWILHGEKSRYVKTAALYAIKKLNDRKAVLPLFKIFTHEKDPVFRDILKDTLSWYIDKYI